MQEGRVSGVGFLSTRLKGLGLKWRSWVMIEMN
jgi:hypothetical protein